LINETDFLGGGLTPERIQTTVSQVPIGRAGKPEDVAATVYFLASEGAECITGEVIHVNFGWLLHPAA
jgi:3-oxoacyl-[acyl-carrier protein] reductase